MSISTVCWLHTSYISCSNAVKGHYFINKVKLGTILNFELNTLFSTFNIYHKIIHKLFRAQPVCKDPHLLIGVNIYDTRHKLVQYVIIFHQFHDL